MVGDDTNVQLGIIGRDNVITLPAEFRKLICDNSGTNCVVVGCYDYMRFETPLRGTLAQHRGEEPHV